MEKILAKRGVTMLVFLFALLIILSIIILLLVLTTIQIQINNLSLKIVQRKDGNYVFKNY